MNIHGAKKGSGKQRQPVIAPDSAQSKAFVSIMYGLGEGEIAGLANGYKSVYLEDTPLQNDNGEFNFPNVKVDFRSGTNDQEYIDGFPDVSSETAVGVELKHGTPFVKAFNNLDLDALRVRLKWGALRSQNRENGNVSGVKIDYAIDVKTDNGGWAEVLNTSINAKTSDAYERSHRIDLPKAQTGWQVRVRRITPNSTSEFISDKMYIAAISELIDLKLRYPNTALLGLRYDAESFSNVAKMSARCRGLIIKVPTNYDPVARTYTGMWDGQFKMAYSNNPAWVYYDLCTAERYGLGGRLTQSMIDKWSLYRLAQYCDEMVDDGMGGQEPRFAVNVYIQSADGAFELLSRLAGVFRAISYWDGNSIVLDADIPQDSIYSFSRANVIDGVFEYTGTRSRDRRTVAKVAWDNPANHFKTEYEYVRDEAAIAKFGVRVADIAAWGCTSRGQAQRAGIWALKSEQLETRMVTFKVGLDGYIPAPAKVIEISDELFAGRATGGRVLAINKTKTVITLDRPITAKAGDTLVINGDDGTSQRRQIRSVSGDKITVTKAFGNISVENVWVLDSQDLATMKFRVLSVTADDNHTFTITAVQYNPAKYDAIDTGAYIDERPISVINPTVQAPTKSVNLSSYHTVNQGVSMTTLVIGWEQVAGAVKYQVEWRKDNGNWQSLPPTGTNSIEIAGVYAGQYEARVTAISAFGQASLATHSNLTQIQGKVGKPNRLAFIRAIGLLFGMNLAWGFGAKSDDTNFTEIEVSPDGRTNITTLGTFAYPTNKFELTGLQGNLTQFYRGRIVDKLGNTSDWTAWVSGTTSADAGKVLELISGQINGSHLDQTLRTPIAKIGTLESAVNGVNAQLPTLNTQIATLNGKTTTLQNELATAKSTLQTAISNITTERNRISGAIRDITALQADKNAKTTEIANLTQTVGSHTSSIRELGVTTGDLSQKYSQLKTASDTANSEIIAIRQTQNGTASSIDRLTSRFDNLMNSPNLLSDTQAKTTTEFLIGAYPIGRTLTEGQKVIVKATTAPPQRVLVYNSSPRGVNRIGEIMADGTPHELDWVVGNGGNNSLHIYRTSNRDSSSVTLDNVSLSVRDGALLDVSAKIETQSQTITDTERSLSERISQIDTAYKSADRTANAKVQQLEQSLSTKERSLSERISQIDTAYKQADRTAAANLSTLERTLTQADSALS
ncbi:host specificity protein J, partial [Moraxella sp. E33BD]|uniref:host specificity protein J n=1 Tax=Moraxella sp. E33BD TaxID=3278713 RepID=UPI00359D8624